MSEKYVIASTSVTDEIRFADGKRVEMAAGGAGIYALCGIKLWHDEVVIVTGVGEDYGELYGPWFEKNHISTEGLICRDKKTPHNVIQYFPDGERSETPLYGPEHYLKIEVTPEDLRPYFQTAKGIYIFKNSNTEFWNQIISLKQQSGAVVMWEIAKDAACPRCLEEVKRIARHVDILSINLAESKELLGVDTLEKVIEKWKEWNRGLVFLRQGAQGAVMITRDQVVFVPSVKNVHVADPTGGGNSSSGAVLYGYCNGNMPLECGLMGSISAAMCLTQYGVPETIGDREREIARGQLESMKAEVHE